MQIPNGIEPGVDTILEMVFLYDLYYDIDNLLFCLKTGKMVWYTLSGSNIPFKYIIQTIYIRLYHFNVLSWNYLRYYIVTQHINNDLFVFRLYRNYSWMDDLWKYLVSIVCFIASSFIVYSRWVKLKSQEYIGSADCGCPTYTVNMEIFVWGLIFTILANCVFLWLLLLASVLFS